MGAVTFSIDARLLECLKGALPLKTFVETGTFRGDALETAAPHFERLVSVELSEQLWKGATARFAGRADMDIRHGDSAQVLAQVAPGLADVPTLYWLDAHWCVAHSTAGDRSQCPLLAEIAAIGRLNEQSIVLIDDARLFLAPPPAPHDIEQWPSFAEVTAALARLSNSHEVMVVNDVIVFHPAAAREALRTHAYTRGIDWLRASQALTENPELRAQIEAKEEEIRRLDEAARTWRGDLEAKEAVIRELSGAVEGYRQAFTLRGVLIRVVNRLARFAPVLAPRLGNLNQHAPRELRLPSHYSVASPPAAAPRISLVTPSFCQAAFIERTIRSVLDQRYPNLEYHVQDGGSDDGTREILERHAGSLASWESRRDNGQSHAINLGFAKATGEIMGWLNSDDVLLPGALAYVADYFVRHPEVDVVYGHRILIDEKDRQIGRWVLPRHDQDVLSWADFVPQETLFWRRRIWDAVGGKVDESFRFAMDWDLLVRFRDAGAKFARLPRYIGGFRIHERQKTSATISDVGFREMDRIRQRALGRVPPGAEVRKAVFPYLLRHIAADFELRVREILGVL